LVCKHLAKEIDQQEIIQNFTETLVNFCDDKFKEIVMSVTHFFSNKCIEKYALPAKIIIPVEEEDFAKSEFNNAVSSINIVPVCAKCFEVARSIS